MWRAGEAAEVLAVRGAASSSAAGPGDLGVLPPGFWALTTPTSFLFSRP